MQSKTNINVPLSEKSLTALAAIMDAGVKVIGLSCVVDAAEITSAIDAGLAELRETTKAAEAEAQRAMWLAEHEAARAKAEDAS